ncbi:hypothetical protein XENTR_v10008914 [Xenopus tropicalis]|nr:hypothetical protein XENTR_v10008914 [Xenopus tropicalis]
MTFWTLSTEEWEECIGKAYQYLIDINDITDWIASTSRLDLQNIAFAWIPFKNFEIYCLYTIKCSYLLL